MKLQLLQVEGNEGETVTAKVSVNKGCGLRFKKDTKVTLTFSNPAAYNVKLQLLQVEGNEGETVTAKVSQVPR